MFKAEIVGGAMTRDRKSSTLVLSEREYREAQKRNGLPTTIDLNNYKTDVQLAGPRVMYEKGARQ